MYKSPEAKKAYQAEYRARNRERLAQQNRDWRISLKQEALDRYGSKCGECGFDDIRALQIDHIENNGSMERRMLGGPNFAGTNFYSWLKKQGWPDGYQTLCANHNWIKYFDLNAPVV